MNRPSLEHLHALVLFDWDWPDMPVDALTRPGVTRSRVPHRVLGGQAGGCWGARQAAGA